MEKSHVQILIGGFIAILLVAVLIGTIASETQTKTTKGYQLNATFDITGFKTLFNNTINTSYTKLLAKGYPGADVRTDTAACNIDDLVIYIGTNATDKALILNTDFNYTTRGLVAFYNSTSMWDNRTNTTLVTYRYCGTDYLTESWSRSLLNVVPGLIALACLVIAVAIGYVILKQENIGDL